MDSQYCPLRDTLGQVYNHFCLFSFSSLHTRLLASHTVLLLMIDTPQLASQMTYKLSHICK